MPLTEKQIRGLKPAPAPKKHFDGEGLFLYVTPAGSKLWRMAYRFEGKAKLLSFGRYPTVSLREARALRGEAKARLANGIDPSAVRKREKLEREAASRKPLESIARSTAEKAACEALTTRHAEDKLSALAATDKQTALTAEDKQSTLHCETQAARTAKGKLSALAAKAKQGALATENKQSPLATKDKQSTRTAKGKQSALPCAQAALTAEGKQSTLPSEAQTALAPNAHTCERAQKSPRPHFGNTLNTSATAGETFEEFARAWHKVRTAAFSEAYGRAILYRLETYVFPSIGKKPLTRLSAVDILGVVKPLDDKGHHETASRILQIIGQIFRYAVILGKVEQNPAASLRGTLKPHTPSRRAAVTSPPKVGQLLRDIDRYEGYFPLVCALKLAPLVFTRHTELRAAEWKDIDIQNAEWRIPAGRTKAGAAHIVPLSRQAVAVLEGLRRYSGGGRYLFPSIRTDVRPISEATMLNALRRMGYEKDEMSVHGFRSLASTLLSERGYRAEWIERQLGRPERNGACAALCAEYLPERRRMMQEWADYLDELKNAA